MMYQTRSLFDGRSPILGCMSDSLAETRSKRSKESYLSRITPWVPGLKCDALFALAASDVGVSRNGGRIGSRWAPQALLATVQKLALPTQPLSIAWTEVSTQQDEEQDFLTGQRHEEERLAQSIPSCQRFLHLGGGHDHILPLLRTLGAKRPLVVLNIDAHCDTRKEQQPHSGNPFRLFAQEAKHPFQLFQVGIHPFANSLSTLEPLPNGEMHILWREDCDDPAHLANFLARLQGCIPPEAALVFSLDCDALKASDVGAVSAPNHHGLELGVVHQLVRWYAQWCQEQGQRHYYGVYEFNPLYDHVSAASARAIAGIVYQMLR